MPVVLGEREIDKIEGDAFGVGVGVQIAKVDEEEELKAWGLLRRGVGSFSYRCRGNLIFMHFLRSFLCWSLSLVLTWLFNCRFRVRFQSLCCRSSGLPFSWRACRVLVAC
jgi:hypothetical protein